MSFLSKFASRKFILSILAFCTATVMCWFGKIDGTIWLAAQAASIGGYIAGNVVQKRTPMSALPSVLHPPGDA